MIDLLDSLDPDPDREPDPTEPDADSEPSLGWSAGFSPELHRQEGRGFHMNANGGHDLEDEHCGCEPEDDSEPDVDGEASLGWTSQTDQTSPHWPGNHLGCVDLEQGIGAVRKKRPQSRTGGKVLRGCEVLV
ncbi:hypothetical protein [Nitrobacter sp.]|uniref:hypothetical protein n=1 Tax=Nitrobacter sp. TaxID=29420 RepID=UPI003F64CF0F